MFKLTRVDHSFMGQRFLLCLSFDVKTRFENFSLWLLISRVYQQFALFMLHHRMIYADSSAEKLSFCILFVEIEVQSFPPQLVFPACSSQ